MMNKRLIKTLVLNSYKNNKLDSNTVATVIDLLKKRKLIKEYIRELKREEKRRSIFITTPYQLSREEYDNLTKAYPNKKIMADIDPNLILGARITRGDLTYELDIKDTLENLISHIKETYD